MTRREEREHIFKLLFLIEFYKEDELEQQESMYFENLSDAKEKDRAYIRKKYENIRENLGQIDEQITEVAKGWRTERMGCRRTDRSSYQRSGRTCKNIRRRRIFCVCQRSFGKTGIAGRKRGAACRMSIQ